MRCFLKRSNTMKTQMIRHWASTVLPIALPFCLVLAAGVEARAQCTQVTSGLREPLGSALTNLGNLLISESGTAAPGSGRISIVQPDGERRTLLGGLPSALNDVNDASGPAGLFMRGRTLYIAMGTGDAGRAGPFPGTTIPNPAPVSSPIFSSILAVQFSANTEKTTTGFTLTAANELALAAGQTITLSDANGGALVIRVIANFPDYIAFPLPAFAGNIQLSNPFQLVAVDDVFYVTDGGRNLVWQVDLLTGSFAPLTSFPNIPNPLFGIVPAGGPFLDAVPTGIAFSAGRLFVTLLRGVPFPPGTSTVEMIDPHTGERTAFISGLKTAIGVLPVREKGNTDYLVLQHASAGPFFASPGLLLRFTSSAAPTVVANCFTRPTTMTLDAKANTLYVTEYGGRVVALLALPVAP
jgi:hypothetical protein